tara:strand:- start:202 stop:348 length:147 start_codon:yes stop_codon:yes gene_type:complete
MLTNKNSISTLYFYNFIPTSGKEEVYWRLWRKVQLKSKYPKTTHTIAA